MVFAKTVERDVRQYDHLLVVFFEARRQLADRVNLQAREHFLVHIGDAARGICKPLALRVFSDGFENLCNGCDYLLTVHCFVRRFESWKVRRLGVALSTYFADEYNIIKQTNTTAWFWLVLLFVTFCSPQAKTLARFGPFWLHFVR